jgi:DNA-directed RNA polymerase subunit omega
MARITVEDCLVQENNRFSLVQLCSKRTKQLLQGATVQTKDRRNKAVVTALREIADGKVRFMTQEESQAYEEQKAREAEEARLAALQAKSDGGAEIFGGAGDDKRSIDFLRNALMQTGPVAAGSDDEDEEE